MSSLQKYTSLSFFREHVGSASQFLYQPVDPIATRPVYFESPVSCAKARDRFNIYPAQRIGPILLFVLSSIMSGVSWKAPPD